MTHTQFEQDMKVDASNRRQKLAGILRAICAVCKIYWKKQVIVGRPLVTPVAPRSEFDQSRFDWER